MTTIKNAAITIKDELIYFCKDDAGRNSTIRRDMSNRATLAEFCEITGVDVPSLDYIRHHLHCAIEMCFSEESA